MSEQWEKSSFSGVEGGNCLEISDAGPHLLLRESEDPDDVLELAPAGLLGLLRYVDAATG
ncbi:DUF397 domain-containing protein [Streptomyces sp. NPDC088812]|uniref:DUF397 domain-containing protein n=1 Tax=Streptomyces sp. NPDC088812 TaxID=3365905 RepID=UPI003822CF8B